MADFDDLPDGSQVDTGGDFGDVPQGGKIEYLPPARVSQSGKVATSEYDDLPEGSTPETFLQQAGRETADVFNQAPAWTPPGAVRTALKTGEATVGGVVSGGEQLGQTATLLAGNEPAPQDRSAPYEQPLEFSDFGSPAEKLLPKLGFATGESLPTLVGGAVGDLAGPWGGAAGAGIMSAAQTLGPAYANLRAEGKSEEDAWNGALKSAGISTAFGAAGWKFFNAKTINGPVRHLVTQGLFVQPGLAVGENALQNKAVYDRPAFEGSEHAFLASFGTTIGFEGHRVLREGARGEGSNAADTQDGPPEGPPDTGPEPEIIPPGGPQPEPPPIPGTPKVEKGPLDLEPETVDETITPDPEPQAAPKQRDFTTEENKAKSFEDQFSEMSDAELKRVREVATQKAQEIDENASKENANTWFRYNEVADRVQDELNRRAKETGINHALGEGPLARTRAAMERDAVLNSPDSLADIVPDFDPVGTASLNQSLANLRTSAARRQRERYRANFHDDQVPRYQVEEDPNHLYTDTDLEVIVAKKGNAASPKGIKRVDITELRPEDIVARVSDLPDTPEDARVLRLGENDPELVREMMAEITLQRQGRGAFTLPEIENLYNRMVDNGLQVVPSHGASFRVKRPLRGGIEIADLPDSGRSKQVLTDTKKGGILQTPLETYPSGRTVDWNKVKDPSEYFISADPLGAMHLKGLEGLDPAEAEFIRQEWNYAALQDNHAAIKEFHEAGVYAEPSRGPAFRGSYDSKLILIKDLPDQVLTIPYKGSSEQMRQAGANNTITQSKGKIYFDRDPEASTQVMKISKEIEDTVKAITSIVNPWLKKNLGVDNLPDIVITERGTDPSGDLSPYVDNHLNKIVFPTKFFMDGHRLAGWFAGDVRAQVTQCYFHELGHLVTLKSWSRLPNEVQGSLEQAYFRAIMTHTVTQESAHFESIFSKEEMGKRLYHLSFVEWQAEQFRRYMSNSAWAQKSIASYFKDVSKSWQDLISYYLGFEKPETTEQRFRESYEFNKYMDYLEAAVGRGEMPVRFRIELDEDGLSYQPPAESDIGQAWQAVRDTLVEFGYLATKDMRVELDASVPKTPGQVDFGSLDANRTMKLIVGAIAWAKGDVGKSIAARRTFVHEAFHGIEGMLSRDDRVELARQADLAEVFPANYEAHYRAEYTKAYSDPKYKLSKEDVRRIVDDKIINEKAAFLAERYKGGQRFETRANKILGKFSEFIRKIWNMLSGRGFTDAQSVLNAFYRGELTKRYNKRFDKAAASHRWDSHKFEPTLAEPLGHDLHGITRNVEDNPYELNGTGRKQFLLYGKDGKEIGFLNIEFRYGEPYVKMIKSKSLSETKRLMKEGTNPSDALINYAEKVLGQKIRSAQEYTDAGYRMASKRDPALVKNYVKIGDLWRSPKSILEALNDAQKTLKEAIEDKWSKQEVAFARASVNLWKEHYDKIPKEGWNDPALHKQWAFRDMQLAEWDKARQIGMAKFTQDTTGEYSRGSEDPYADAAAEAREAAEAINARATGYTYGAAPQPEVHAFRDFVRKAKVDPATARVLHGQVHHADKMWGVAKGWWTIHQLAWKNPHVEWLRRYVSVTENLVQRSMEWVSRSSETAADWANPSKMGGKGQDALLSKLLFWATEMRYRTPQEKAAGVSRQPTAAEIMGEAQRLGMSRQALQMYGRISKDFGDFLTKMETIFAAQIVKQLSNPADQQKALNTLRADMNAMRNKPYFPMTRFGKYTVTFKDTTGKVLHFSAYTSSKAAEEAARKLKPRYQLADGKVGLLPDEVQDFMGLPKPMLDRILNNMPELSQVQQDWLRRFTHSAAPENSFRKRWLERKGTPGYSLDGIRVYADYFRRASKYLARLEFRDELNQIQNDAAADVKLQKSGVARQMMLDMVNNHMEWMNKPGKDFVNFKAAITNWFLGFSPAAAFTNLTQTTFFTMPYIGSIFGYSKMHKTYTGVIEDASRTAFGHLSNNATPDFREAHAEMVAQGQIETGQAAELGSFADHDSLDKSFIGDKMQKFWRGYSYVGMLMFSKVERFNREVTFSSVFKLAMEQPNNKHVIDISQYKMAEIADLQARRPSMSYDAAVATYVAREAIDRTQGIFKSYDRPRFMRSGAVNTMAIFMSYAQQTIFNLRNNPGKGLTMMMMLAAYGASGMPGAENMDDIIWALSRRVFGKDFSPLRWMRGAVRDMTRGGPLETVGPDLAMHGISRYGYGIGLLPEQWGAPRFDASGNGSMGDLIPGVSALAKGVASAGGADTNVWKETVSDVVKDTAGAGYGPFFSMFQFMNSPPGSDSWKQWESIMPRAFKAASKAGRFAYNGAETNNSGADTVKFDMTDPDDIATVAAQALGFTPTKLSEYYDSNREYYDRKKFYDTRQFVLRNKFENARQANDPAAFEEARQKVVDYNQEVIREGLGSMVIKPESLSAGAKIRAKSEAMTESGLPVQKKYIPLKRQTDDLYPGQLIEQKKVR